MRGAGQRPWRASSRWWRPVVGSSNGSALNGW